MLTYWETLIAVRSNIAVNDSYAQLWGRKLSNAYSVATYTGTLPATLQTVEGYLESYKIYGNSTQDGTPTPENPIMPSGCGEKTENLYNWGTDIQYMFVTIGGKITDYGASSANYISEKIHVVAGKTYQLIRPITVSGTGLYAAFYDENDAALSATALSLNSSYTLEAPTGASYFRTSLKRNDAENDISMFTEGSTALPYEPYGYKLPLTVNDVEYPIYLGEVETTRRIKKLVLTGEENWVKNDTSPNNCLYYLSGLTDKERADCICTHFQQSSTTYPAKNQISAKAVANMIFIYLSKTIIDTMPSGNTKEGFKEYLAAQYAAGTPVTVWYVLAEPKTAVVNEPLMKIGDYADTIDSTQSTVRIPTFAGVTTISYGGTGVQPEKVELQYKVKR